jgi:glycosyltransferase involved in cell wall biosynthesis
MSISIIIPVYNEEDCIERCVRETQEAFRDADYEIIIVNDGSTDRSHGVIAGLVNGNQHIRCVEYATNKGYSHAIRQGIQLARKEYTSYLDADLQYPPSQLRQMYDFASRDRPVFVLGKPMRKYYNPYRQLLSYGYNFLVSRLLHLPVTDANSLKLIKTETLKKLPLKRELGAIELEVLVGIANQSLPIHFFPIRVQQRVAGKSKTGLKLIGPTLKSIMELRRVRRTDATAGR